MASSDKPTAVHFTLIFFVMLSLILLVVAFLRHRDWSLAQAQLDAKTAELSTANTAIANNVRDFEALRSALGYSYDQIGAQGAANTVIGALMNDLALYGRDLQAQTVAATLAAMRTSLDKLQSDLENTQAALKKEQDALLALRAQYQEQIAQLEQSQTASESNLQKTIAEREQILQAKDQELTAVRSRYVRSQTEMAQLKDQMDALREDYELQVADLVKFNTKLRSDLDEIKQVSFEVPDGEIRRVDNTTRTVWINLGKADGLKEQTTFSVYDQAHHGVARGPEDIKGRIEVTRVLGPHLSQARILEENLHRPMAEFDVVYSPVWTAGLVEKFAFVGEIDFEGDGLGDRALLHDMLDRAGAQIALEVNDEGYRQPEKAQITPEIKFLVLGSIPDPTQFASDDPNRDRIERLQKEQTELIERAQQQGVRVMNLTTFLEFMGYKPTQRLYVPGKSTYYTIEAADDDRRSATGDSKMYSGRTSGLFRQKLDRTGKPVAPGIRNYER